MALSRAAIGSGLILVTGATGFVGSALVARLAREGLETRACVRRNDASLPDVVHTVQVGGLTADADWSHALAGVSAVVHLSAIPVLYRGMN